MTVARCSRCGNGLTDVAGSGRTTPGGVRVVRFVRGFCPRCGVEVEAQKGLRWEDVFGDDDGSEAA